MTVTGTRTISPVPPDARVLIADKGIKARVPERPNRNEPAARDAQLHRKRDLIERMFGRIKDRRRTATRHDHRARIFFGATRIAATAVFRIRSPSLAGRLSAPQKAFGADQ